MKSIRNIKKIYIVIFILLIISAICFYASYAFFTSANEEHGKLNIVAGTLEYEISSTDLQNNRITVPANTTKSLSLSIKSNNEINSKYELYYLLDTPNNDVIVGYDVGTPNPVTGSIDANSEKDIDIIIKNNSSNATTVQFKVIGGLIGNSLVRIEGNSLNTVIDNEPVFKDIILANNTLVTSLPTLTTSSANTSNQSGLYASTDTNSGNPTYYFRGNVTNNYVNFAGLTWRIVRINEDGSVRLVLYTGINNNTGYVYSTNAAESYYSKSTAKGTIETWYNTNLTDYDNMIATSEYCEQLRVLWNTGFSAGAASAVAFANYTPTFKCSTDGNGYGPLNLKIGLLNYDEVVYAGGYPIASNTSYYLYNGSTSKIMSPAAVNAYSWRITEGYSISYGNTGAAEPLRVVINLKKDISVIGTGTSTDPYKIKYYVDNDDFNNKIIANNTVVEKKPTLTSTSASANENGLYTSIDTNSGNRTFYFRGNVTNNYVSFAGFTWRIVRINEDGSIRLIMTSGINNNTAYSFSDNMQETYYSGSTAKTTLETWYNSNLKSYDNLIVTSDYCEQLRVLWGTNYNGKLATAVAFSNYKPTFSCEIDGNGHGSLNLNIGLLSYDEAVYAGGYPSGTNTTYYLYNGYSSKLISPAGFNQSYNEKMSWILTNQLPISYSDTDKTATLRPVINLRKDVNVTGLGTSTSPYVIQ